MKNLILGVALMALTVVNPVAGSSVDGVRGDAAEGERLSKVCAGCHGVDGNSLVPNWPKLAGQGRRYLREQLAAFKSGVRNNAQMAPMVAGLSEQAMADLAAYFAGQTVSIGTVDPDHLAAGRQVYQGGDQPRAVAACMGCHGPSGRGNPAAGYPALAGQHAAYTVSQLKAFAEGTRRHAMMSPIAANMNQAQMTAVASYIEGLY